MSMTKPPVTTALLKLVEQGRVSLEDPLTKYFPEFEQMMVALTETLEISLSQLNGK